MTQRIHIDLRPPGHEPIRILSPLAIHNAILEAIEPGSSSHARSSDFADGSPHELGVYVAYHRWLDVEIVVDDRTPEERS